MIRAFKFRLRPNKAQAEALDTMLGDFCALYNACLEQRVDAYRRRGVTIRAAQQMAELKAVREADPALARWSFTGLQQVVRRVDKTYAAFFRRGRGFPRFRSRARFDSADMRVGDGLTIRKTRRLGVVGVPGEVKAVWHRDLPPGAKLGHAVLSRQAGRWFACFQVEFETEVSPHAGPAVGIDLGLHSLIATSDGETVEAPRFARKAAASLRRKHRALGRCKPATAAQGQGPTRRRLGQGRQPTPRLRAQVVSVPRGPIRTDRLRGLERQGPGARDARPVGP